VSESRARTFRSRVAVKMRPPAVTTGPTLGVSASVFVAFFGSRELTQRDLPAYCAFVEVVSRRDVQGGGDGAHAAAGDHEAEGNSVGGREPTLACARRGLRDSRRSGSVRDRIFRKPGA